MRERERDGESRKGLLEEAWSVECGVVVFGSVRLTQWYPVGRRRFGQLGGVALWLVRLPQDAQKTWEADDPKRAESGKRRCKKVQGCESGSGPGPEP